MIGRKCSSTASCHDRMICGHCLFKGYCGKSYINELGCDGCEYRFICTTRFGMKLNLKKTNTVVKEPVPPVGVIGSFGITDDAFMAECWLRTKDHTKCETCDFRFKCYTQKWRTEGHAEDVQVVSNTFNGITLASGTYNVIFEKNTIVGSNSNQGIWIQRL